MGRQVRPLKMIEMMIYLIAPGGGRFATQEARAVRRWQAIGMMYRLHLEGLDT
jgi:hypothetical protein